MNRSTWYRERSHVRWLAREVLDDGPIEWAGDRADRLALLGSLTLFRFGDRGARLMWVRRIEIRHVVETGTDDRLRQAREASRAVRRWFAGVDHATTG